ncbi:MAG: alpha/beta hydrolase [Flavobacterium sp.]|uniref:alpha/beta hydrolase n=1 Tax=Flavobacterium sp. TaxID=239 RepID=UPI0012279BAC|nr:alpha/beta hydrolase [Flavobacterium sp.]RZJ65877.1 MAG: alpha/beta hydrolase [Flavobacterium sp.]
MKNYISIILFALLFATSCNSTDDNQNDVENLPASDLLNVSYGTDSQQKMDVYLPANRTSQTKVFILIHGGGWSGGSRADMTSTVPVLKSQFPNHAIVNIDYRLATQQSPGFPKQIEDIEKVIDYLKSADYQIDNKYGLIGASAGAHLSMLYGYKYDPDHEVEAICSLVGPTDFTDPSYTENPIFMNMLGSLVGNENYEDNPEIFAEVSPRTHVSATSPATIQFAGGQDPLIPVSQGTRLKQRLDENGVYNEYYLYPNGGHGDWDAATWIDFQIKMVAFFQSRF